MKRNLNSTFKLRNKARIQIYLFCLNIEIVTCIKSWWWDKLFLMWVHACEQCRLVHYVKAGVNLKHMCVLYFRFFRIRNRNHTEIMSNDGLNILR